LLKGLDIWRCNQVWEVDITYVPMAHGFMYLTAVIDVYSRYIVGWGISNSLDAQSSLRVVEAAIEVHGAPEIINSDQGSQFTCKEHVEFIKTSGIQISMDGKGGHWIISISNDSGKPSNISIFISILQTTGSNYMPVSKNGSTDTITATIRVSMQNQ